MTSSSCSSFATFGSFFESSNAFPFRCSAKLEANSCFASHSVKISAPFDYYVSCMAAMAISCFLCLGFAFAVTVANLVCLHPHNYCLTDPIFGFKASDYLVTKDHSYCL